MEEIESGEEPRLEYTISSPIIYPEGPIGIKREEISNSQPGGSVHTVDNKQKEC